MGNSDVRIIEEGARSGHLVAMRYSTAGIAIMNPRLFVPCVTENKMFNSIAFIVGFAWGTIFVRNATFSMMIIGGEENFFHCNKCGCCYSTVLKNSHNCVEKAMHHNCAVCFEVASTVMPQIYQNKMVWILCNDCGENSEVNFHIVAHKCLKCNSYNTRQTRGGPLLTVVEWGNLLGQQRVAGIIYSLILCLLLSLYSTLLVLELLIV
ncbi:RCHY1 [Theobroma cacao]|nr:RCHY1 [Theobroma cacao]